MECKDLTFDKLPETTCFPRPIVAERDQPVGLMYNI